MAEDVSIRSMPDESRYGTSLKMWHTLRNAHGMPASVEEDIALFLRCRKAVINGMK